MPLEELLSLSRELGNPDRHLAILAEGNTSARGPAETFWVKGSGHNLSTLTSHGIASCRAAELLSLLDRKKVTDEEMTAALLAARTDPAAPKPSVEAVFHAWLLTLPDVNFVGHTHPVSVNSLLCTRHGRTFARRRIFPDEIVCCGAESVYVPYCDPGLKLAQAIRSETTAYLRRRGEVPRVILLENHGLIALGKSGPAVLAATLMADKAARIFLGAAATGPIRFLTPAHVARIAGRPDEHHRQKILGI